MSKKTGAAIGSVVALTDKKQKVVESFAYDSFGNTQRHGDEVKQPYAYTGREWDRETGLYYYRARYYDPTVGRFDSKDPIGFKGGINLYDYTSNNPTIYVDPMGLSSKEVGGGFSFTVPGLSFTTGLTTETCCDANGNKHRRTIRTTCVGFSLGAEVGSGGGPGTAAVSIVRDTKMCIGNVGDTYDYNTDDGFGFSSNLILGASWSSSDPRTTKFTTGLGISIDFWSTCKNGVIQDVIIGRCCHDEQ